MYGENFALTFIGKVKELCEAAEKMGGVHVESTVSLAIEGIMRLAEVAGVEIKGNIFGMA